MNSANQKLLVVDDDRGIQKQLRCSLDAYQVVVAGDRPSVLGQVRRYHPPVVTLWTWGYPRMPMGPVRAWQP